MSEPIPAGLTAGTGTDANLAAERGPQTTSSPVLATIVIPCIRVERLVERCVRECARKCPSAELMVIPDQPDGIEKIETMARVIVSGPCTIAAKRNLAARNSGARYLAFIDSDAYPEEGWLDNAVRLLEADAELGAVGGPNVSPPEQTRSERYVGLALRSIFVSGMGNFRKTICPPRLCDDLPSCNLIVRGDEFLAMGGMDEALFTGEDMDFCMRLRAQGKKILYSPDVLVYHKNRNLWLFFNQRLTYGASVFRLIKTGLRGNYIVLFLPAAFILFLLSAPFIALWTFWAWIYGGVVAVYLTAVMIETARQGETSRDWPGTFLTLIIGNLAPGLGTIGKALGLLPDLRKIYRIDT